MSLESPWLVIISLIQRKNENKYDSNVFKLFGGVAVDRWLKNPIKGQDDISFESPHFRSIRSNEILRENNGSLWWGV